MEALRRLRRNQTDNNVDRRLVTNVLISFLTTPRADGKRFEMLNLLASILQWSDVEREKRIASIMRSAPQDAPEGSIGMGPGRTGVKGVIRDRDEANTRARETRAREIKELNQRMEKASLGGKTFLEEERE